VLPGASKEKGAADMRFTGMLILRVEIADKLAKKGLSRRKLQSSYTSLAYIGRAAREKILEQWKNNWQQNKNKGKHYTRICKGSYSFSLKAPKDKYPKRLQSAFFQLKLGKGYFKSFSKVIGGRTKMVDALGNVEHYKPLGTYY